METKDTEVRVERVNYHRASLSSQKCEWVPMNCGGSLMNCWRINLSSDSSSGFKLHLAGLGHLT